MKVYIFKALRFLSSALSGYLFSIAQFFGELSLKFDDIVFDLDRYIGEDE